MYAHQFMFCRASWRSSWSRPQTSICVFSCWRTNGPNVDLTSKKNSKSISLSLHFCTPHTTASVTWLFRTDSVHSRRMCIYEQESAFPYKDNKMHFVFKMTWIGMVQDTYDSNNTFYPRRECSTNTYPYFDEIRRLWAPTRNSECTCREQNKAISLP